LITTPDLVLVADDDQDVLRFVEVNLRLEGFEVETVTDGEAALAAAFDLIILGGQRLATPWRRAEAA
jgi:DNA-binding response OmpR family regulator